MNIGNNSPEGEIKRRIRMSNHITFAEFMGIALFWPKGGYYTGESPIGSTGDYYTRPSVHPVFGALIATQVFQIWDLMGRPESFHIIEPGAGNGLLARDILSSVHGLSTDFADAIRYVCLDYRSEQAWKEMFALVATVYLLIEWRLQCQLSHQSMMWIAFRTILYRFQE